MRVADLAALFSRHNLTTLDMVALSGAQTVGFAHCTRFTGRLYRHGAVGDGDGAHAVDPSYDPAYARQLMTACPPDVGETIAVDMDPVTPTAFDNAYYGNLARGMGLFTSDQALYSDGARRRVAAGGEGLRREPDALLRGVQGRHGQAGQSWREDRQAWGDQERLHRIQQVDRGIEQEVA